MRLGELPSGLSLYLIHALTSASMTKAYEIAIGFMLINRENREKISNLSPGIR
jgi:hypothetical protein